MSRLSWPAPLNNAEYRRLFIAQVIALVGTGLSTVALTLLAFDLAGGNAGVVLGTALAIKMIAYVVFAPIVGGLAHRMPRKGLLIGLDIVRALIVLMMPFVTAVWQIYALIFLLNLFSAGFKPVFAAAIPDILPDEKDYTRALSYSRLAYDLDTLLSPLLAGLALLFLSFTSLFMANAIAFVISAGLILVTALPAASASERVGNTWHQISFGIVAYMKTPRLRALLVLYMAVASASAMVIVNTVVYVRDNLGGTDSDTAMALAAAGGGSMLAALTLPRILERMSDRSVMLGGGLYMALGLGLMSTGPSLPALLAYWFVVGFGWSLIQTPAGRLLNRSAAPTDRSAYFAAQFSLSHACWLIGYPVAGQLGAAIGLESTGFVFCIAILAFTALSALLWPKEDDREIEHTHQPIEHSHYHVHDAHHAHHDGAVPEGHKHPHTHEAVRHAHTFFIDDHHRHWPNRA